MADIFISYARDDLAKARALAEALGQQGWSVWWDRTIPTGRTFDEVIEAELDAAKCVVVLWSTTSVHSQWVRTEAQEGMDRKILAPITIDEARIPLAFRRIQAADFVDWDGTESAEAFQNLVVDLARLLGEPHGTGQALEVERATDEQSADRQTAPVKAQRVRYPSRLPPPLSISTT